MRWSVPTILGSAVLAATAVSVEPASAAPGPCSITANVVSKACANEVMDDYWIALANCTNVSNADERTLCQEEARDEWQEARVECAEQLDARLELCEALGEQRYDPDFEPDDFETDFTNLNPYFPLAPGNRWVYEAEDEMIVVEVLDKTKWIEGVTCIVVNDLVSEAGGGGGAPIEDTDDWYGQAENGDVYYCGEISRDYETFDGDDPEEPELVEIEGSWKTGRERAKPGILMFASPAVGTVYRQEMSLGNAEDAAEVLSNGYGYGSDPDLDQLVPEDLAELLCDDDCVVTRDFTPIEPDTEERKYYAPGIGLFLEVNLEEGTTTRLVDCNLGPACAQL